MLLTFFLEESWQLASNIVNYLLRFISIFNFFGFWIWHLHPELNLDNLRRVSQ